MLSMMMMRMMMRRRRRWPREESTGKGGVNMDGYLLFLRLFST